MKLGDFLQLRGWERVPVEKPKGVGPNSPPHDKWRKDGVVLEADEAKLMEWREDWRAEQGSLTKKHKGEIECLTDQPTKDTATTSGTTKSEFQLCHAIRQVN